MVDMLFLDTQTLKEIRIHCLAATLPFCICQEGWLPFPEEEAIHTGPFLQSQATGFNKCELLKCDGTKRINPYI